MKAGDAAYFRSVDAEKIRALKDAYLGQRCFVVGNGPSLISSDLDLLCGEYSFATNRISKYFDSTVWRPSFYVADDMDVIKGIATSINEMPVQYKFINQEAKKLVFGDNVIYLNTHLDYFSLDKHTTKNISFSFDVSQRISVGYTVTYICIQLAQYMGFKNIYLLGMDHSYSRVIDSNNKIYIDGAVVDHGFSDLGAIVNPQFLEGVEFAYELAKESAEQQGTKIFNATRGGTLEVFPRIDLDSVIGGNDKGAV